MINLKSVYFSYEGNTNYNLENININIPKGHYISVVGENGSYKTTLVRIIIGALKIQKGVIERNYNRIGYVPQRLEGFNSSFSITVYEILKIHLKALKIKDLKEIDRVLSLVHMKKFENSLIGALSGGQQQRIFIARALMGSPDLLVLDELSTGIDEKTQDEIYELITNLNKKNNITILSVEHNRKKAITYSTKILELNYGKATLLSKSDYIRKLGNVEGGFYNA